MVNAFIKGVHFFFLGFRLIFKPGLRHYIVIPIIFNAILLVIVFSGLAFFLFYHFNSFIAGFPYWVMVFLGWLFWIIYSLISLMVSTFIFTILTNIIASPFYGILAEAAANIIINEKQGVLIPEQNQDFSNFSNTDLNSTKSSRLQDKNWLKTILVMAPRTLAREGRKLLYFLPWVLFCLLLLLFPLSWLFFPFVWWIVLAWILAVQYIDYQPDNQEIHFKEVLNLLKQNFFTVIGFGSMVSLAMMIPGANLFVPPAAVVGGTVLWLSLQRLSMQHA